LAGKKRRWKQSDSCYVNIYNLLLTQFSLVLTQGKLITWVLMILSTSRFPTTPFSHSLSANCSLSFMIMIETQSFPFMSTPNMLLTFNNSFWFIGFSMQFSLKTILNCDMRLFKENQELCCLMKELVMKLNILSSN